SIRRAGRGCARADRPSPARPRSPRTPPARPRPPHPRPRARYGASRAARDNPRAADPKRWSAAGHPGRHRSPTRRPPSARAKAIPPRPPPAAPPPARAARVRRRGRAARSPPPPRQCRNGSPPGRPRLQEQVDLADRAVAHLVGLAEDLVRALLAETHHARIG